MDSGSYKWDMPIRMNGTPEPVNGEMAIVSLPVQVVFEWSDKIVADVDDQDNPIEYQSGFLMQVIPGQKFVYQNQPRTFVAHTFKENS